MVYNIPSLRNFTEFLLTAFLVLLCLRILLYGEIKHYKSPIRIKEITKGI